MDFAYRRERLGQVRDEGRFPQSFEAAGIGWPIEQPHEPQDREGPLSMFTLALKPPHIGIHDAERVAALFFVCFL